MALNLEDKSGNGNNLTNSGGSAYTATQAFTGSNVALDCTGGNNYAYIADNASVSITGDLTIEAWIRMDNLPNETSMSIVSKDDGSTNRSWDFRVSEAGTTFSLQFLYSDDGSSVTTHSVTWSTPSADTWYHVACVFDASAHSTEMFVGGSSIGSASGGTKTSIYDGNANMDIGIARSSGTPAFSMDGYIDEVRVWNDKRTGTELTNNKDASLSNPTGEANLIAYYDWEEIITANSYAYFM